MNRKILSVLVLLITAINFAAFSQETGSADELYTSHPNVFHLSFDSDFSSRYFGAEIDMHVPVLNRYLFLYTDFALLPKASSLENFSSWVLYPAFFMGAGANFCIPQAGHLNFYGLAAMGATAVDFYHNKDRTEKSEDNKFFETGIIGRLSAGIDFPFVFGIDLFAQYNFDYFLNDLLGEKRHSVSVGWAFGKNLPITADKKKK